MKNLEMQSRLGDEILAFIAGRRSLQLATLRPDGTPYASYAPFAVGDECFYVLLSEMALHAVNLQVHPVASVLLIEDESEAAELFARVRVNYTVAAELIAVDSVDWHIGIDILAARHGQRVRDLSSLSDFCLFRLRPTGGRYVKGFGRAYTLAGGTLNGESIDHLTDGHRKRETEAAAG